MTTGSNLFWFEYKISSKRTLQLCSHIKSLFVWFSKSPSTVVISSSVFSYCFVDLVNFCSIWWFSSIFDCNSFINKRPSPTPVFFVKGAQKKLIELTQKHFQKINQTSTRICRRRLSRKNSALEKFKFELWRNLKFKWTFSHFRLLKIPTWGKKRDFIQHTSHQNV